MEKTGEQKHFLALLSRPGDYIFIDIAKLDIANGYNPSDLSDIDSFTMHFTKDEIMASIIRANIVSSRYLEGTLVIQDNQKHNPLPVIDKDFYGDFQLDIYLNNKFNDKNTLNKVANKLWGITKSDAIKKSFVDALRTGNLDIAIEILLNLPYLKLRKLIIYLVEMYNFEKTLKNDKELIRDKIAI